MTEQTTNTPLNTPPTAPQPDAIDWAPHIPKGSEKVFEPFKGKPLGDVLNSVVEAQKLIGGSIRLPKPDAKPEERQKILDDVYTKLGRPASPDKYDVGELPDLGPRFQWNDERLTAAKAELHKAGLTNDQAKTVFKLFSNELKGLFPDPSVAAAEAREALIKDYGSEALFNRNLKMAHGAIKQYGDADLVTFLESTGLGNHPQFVKFMAKIGRELVEHGAAEPATEHDYMSEAEAQKQINAILNDKNDVYHSRPGTPGREARIQEVQQLYKIIHGEA